ncbi:MAG: tRNA pseudouridine(38-40) synthase TruA [Acidobacteriota bacterium]
MTNFKALIQYDGTDFNGWQIQPDKRTVQGAIEEALRIISGERVVCNGASRTDAGVHATGQIANFHVKLNIHPQSLIKALNSILPRDIRIIEIEEINESFDARVHAKSKIYIYKIWNDQIISPFIWRWYYHVPFSLDFESMAEASKYFVGEKDFSSFTSHPSSNNFKRTVFRSELLKKEKEIIYTIEANGFLRYMVRNIVGTLIEVGRGKINPSSIPEIIDEKKREAAGPTALPSGLFLDSVIY